MEEAKRSSSLVRVSGCAMMLILTRRLMQLSREAIEALTQEHGPNAQYLEKLVFALRSGQFCLHLLCISMHEGDAGADETIFKASEAETSQCLFQLKDMTHMLLKPAASRQRHRHHRTSLHSNESASRHHRASLSNGFSLQV